jgi:hypothetical protein
LVQRHRRRHNRQAQPTNNPPGDHHRKRALPVGASLQRGSDAARHHAHHAGVPAAQVVAGRVREKDIAQPRAQVVDGGDEARLGRLWVVQSRLEARVRVDGRDDADVVSGQDQRLAPKPYFRAYPQTKDPSAKKAHREWRRKTALEIPVAMIDLGSYNIWQQNTPEVSKTKIERCDGEFR